MYLLLAELQALWPNPVSPLILERALSHSYHYKGYACLDDTTVAEDGSCRARAIIVRIVDGRARSQRFIDLETFAEENVARQRAIAAAREWIDDEEGKDDLALPTNFACLLS